jgi:hypothetical protein
MMKKVIVYKTSEQKDIDYYGFLHGFSVESEELDVGAMHSPVAIVEKAFTGQLALPYVPLIQIENKTDSQLCDDGNLSNWTEIVSKSVPPVPEPPSIEYRYENEYHEKD